MVLCVMSCIEMTLTALILIDHVARRDAFTDIRKDLVLRNRERSAFLQTQLLAANVVQLSFVLDKVTNDSSDDLIKDFGSIFKDSNYEIHGERDRILSGELQVTFYISEDESCNSTSTSTDHCAIRVNEIGITNSVALTICAYFKKPNISCHKSWKIMTLKLCAIFKILRYGYCGFQSCTLWNIVPERTYFVCATLAEHQDNDTMIPAIHDTSDEQTREFIKRGLTTSGIVVSVIRNECMTIFVLTAIRQPPVIDCCVAYVEDEDRLVIEDASKPVHVVVLQKDELKLFCNVNGHPKPTVRWCKSNENCTEVDEKGSFTIVSGSKQNEGMYYCIVENKYGRAVSAAMHVTMAELHVFTSNDVVKHNKPVGESLRMECRYPYSDDSLLFAWKKVKSWGDPAPETMVPNDRIILSFDGSLSFLYIQPEDDGKYMCFVKNLHMSSGVTGSQTELKVDAPDSPGSNKVPHLLKRSPEIIRIIAGDSVKIQCLFGGKPIPTMKWFSGNQDLMPSERIRYDSGNQTVEIRNVTVNDSEDIQCEASNSEGTSQRFIFQLLIHEKPRFLQKLTSVRAVVGDSPSFKCNATGKPVPNIIWRINGRDLQDSANETMLSLSKDSTEMTVYNVTRAHTFNVQCNASNTYGYALYNAYLITTGRHQVAYWVSTYNINAYEESNPWFVQCSECSERTRILRGPDDVILNGQLTLRFDCSFQTDQSTTATITWLKGNKELSYDGHRIYTLANYSLVLNLAGEDDGGLSTIGNYTCLVSNGLTSDARSAKLRPLLVDAASRIYSNGRFMMFWPFSEISDKMWLLIICVLASLIVISFVAVLITCHARCTTSKATNNDNLFTSTNSRIPESHEMKVFKRWSTTRNGGTLTPATDGSFVCENRRCFALDEESVDIDYVQEALRELFVERSRLRIGNTIGRGLLAYGHTEHRLATVPCPSNERRPLQGMNFFGQFGRVYCAFLSDPNGKVEDQQVAVKTMKYKPEETEMADLFLREAVLMKDFQHAHILGVLGITFDPDGSPMVILPFMHHGDMRNYIMNSELDITVLRLLGMSLQVAHGMAYLSGLRFVHRDLAARNCMVDEFEVVKVADFGLSRELILNDYYRLSHNKTPVPVRWMAPECLEANVFTSRSDVWSFGVLLWELVTRGAVPFSDIENWEVANYIKSGKRLLQPIYCPDSVYQIMQNCWEQNPLNRPTFDTVARDIERVVASAQSPNFRFRSAGVHFYSNGTKSSPETMGTAAVEHKCYSHNACDL